MVFENLDTPTQMFTEPVSGAAGTEPTLTPFGNTAHGIGERWVPCTTWLTFQGDVVIGDQTLQQVRLDPKYFITSEYGPVVYYDRLLALSATLAQLHGGRGSLDPIYGSPTDVRNASTLRV